VIESSLDMWARRPDCFETRVEDAAVRAATDGV
jgi:hypothetical protein